MESVQDDIFELGRVECCEVSMRYNTTYPEECGFKIDTNVMELFESSDLDGLYFISVPHDEIKNCNKKLDEYPIYYADLAQGEIIILNQNFKLFMKNLLGNKNTKDIDKFSDNIIKQTVPDIEECEEEDE